MDLLLEEWGMIACQYDTAMSWAMLRELSDQGVSIRLPKTRVHAFDHEDFEASEAEKAALFGGYGG